MEKKYGQQLLSACCGLFWFLAVKAQGQPATVQNASVYESIKISGKICLDGKLSEEAWQRQPPVVFRDMVNGSEPFYRTQAKVIWDEEYLYVGLEIEDPNVWARVGLKDSECPPEYVERINRQKEKTDPEWYRLECEIMNLDKFVKVFLDPDADGEDYLEFHVNALNNVFDAWYHQGLQEGEQHLKNPHVSWTCPGLMTAVAVEGTLNAPHDLDRGWELEMAIPWKSLKPLVKGDCPPRPGDHWGILLGRVHRNYFWSPERFYWTWPVIGETNCHRLATYAKLVFGSEHRKFLRLFAGGATCPEETIAQAREIGVTDLCTTSVDALQKFVELGSQYDLDIYGVVSLSRTELWPKKYPGDPIPLQQMQAEEIKIRDYLRKKENRVTIQYQYGEQPQSRNPEVLITDLLCFHDKKVRALFQEETGRLAKTPGLKGIMFDFFGYQNYHSCYCPVSTELFASWYKEHGQNLDREKAWEKFSEETLTGFYNDLISQARVLNPQIKMLAHTYPVFLPDPFYGRKLDLDYWVQTVAWYFPRDFSQIASSTRYLVAHEKEFFSRNQGVALVGFYHRPELFPVKTPERVEKELATILENGCPYVFVYSIKDVLKIPEIKEVFRRYFRR